MGITEYLLPGDWVRPDDITLGAAGHFFSGSSADGTVYRGRLDEPTGEIWLPAGTDGRTAAFGMDRTAQPGRALTESSAP
jgi:Cu-Zn family superoxide dismutase